MGEISLLFAGDIIVDRADPRSIFRHVGPLVRDADISFVQAEQEFSDIGYPVAKWSVYSDPRIAPAVKEAGFDVVSMAGNHAVDWGEESLLDSLEQLERAGLVAVGAGPDLESARAPVFVERDGVKVAYVAYCAVGPDEYSAGPGRPGFAPVKVWTLYDQYDVQPGTPPRILTYCERPHLEAVRESVERAKENADVVVASFHWGIHYVSGLAEGLIPDYETELGHLAIDRGADIVIGTHPHIIRGVEVYRGKAIFHSLGNFAVEVPTEFDHLWDGRLHMDYGRKMIEKLNAHRGGLWDLLFRYYGVKPEGELLSYALPKYPMPEESRKTMLVTARASKGGIEEVAVVPVWIGDEREPEPLTRESARWADLADYIRGVTKASGFATEYREEADRLVVHTG